MSAAGGVVLDTSVIVPYFRGDRRLASRIKESTPVYLPLVSLGELRYGARRAARPDEGLAQIREFLGTVELLFPDARTAEAYGDLKAELARLGLPIPDNDLWIAAAARQHNLLLATRDAHFSHVPGLRTIAC